MNSRNIIVIIAAVASVLGASAVSAQDVLTVVDQSVGINTSSPNAPLEIFAPSGNAAFRLNVNGATTWTISNTGSLVTFNLIGSGGQEATFRQRNNAAGHTFEVQGNVAGTTFVNTSSRELKTAFAEVDKHDLLGKLAQLPVTSWNYKQDGTEARHIGPIAEDFQRAFGIGDGAGITTVDAQGVAFAAIQALNEQLQAKNARIEALEQQNSELASRLSTLENLVVGAN